jgi:hypothetical protein
MEAMAVFPVPFPIVEHTMEQIAGTKRLIAQISVATVVLFGHID